MEQLEGTIENIIFQSDSGFVVFRLKPLQGQGTITVTGGLATPLVGEQVELKGSWIEHPRFGQQFKAESCRRVAPTSIKGIERFLASGAIKGVGPSVAAKLVAYFGSDTLRILEEKPKRLEEVPGIGPKKARQIHESYTEQSEMRDIMLFLEMYGITGAYAAKIYQQYGMTALQVLEENPYRLAREVSGIGFRTADQLAMALGWEKDRRERIASGIDYALLQVSLAGHCCVPEEALIGEAAKLLGVERLEVALAISELRKKDRLCVEEYHGVTLMYPWHLHKAERETAQLLLELRDQAREVGGSDYQQLVDDWESAAGLKLAAEQREAMLSSLKHGILVLTGGPGTGKTTVVRGIMELLEQQGLRILLGAPTGRAAKRLSEATGREAMTVHRMLEANGGVEGTPAFLRGDDLPLEADVVILDEVSMMDVSLMHSFLTAVQVGCRVILVGDVDQLPAVGPGAVLKDIIRSAQLPVVRLEEVFRQSGESQIILNAHRINRGQQPQFGEARDFSFIELDDGEAAAQRIVRLCLEELAAEGFEPLKDIQVLSPMHRQTCGVENLNHMLQAALNPPKPNGESVPSGVHQLRGGDKVMQMRNNYLKGVYNGDIGFVNWVSGGKVSVIYPEQEVIYEKAELTELHLAYAMSVHKSQGSEYPVVVMPLSNSHRIMLQRNLLYTAITRAKKKVVLVGSKAALNTALGNDRTKRRYTLLAERLQREI